MLFPDCRRTLFPDCRRTLFSDCTALEELDLSFLNTKGAQAYGILSGDTALKKVTFGEGYGWLVAELMTPETKWGYDAVNSLHEKPEESWERLSGRIRQFFPGAGDGDIRRVIGIRK